MRFIISLLTIVFCFSTLTQAENSTIHDKAITTDIYADNSIKNREPVIIKEPELKPDWDLFYGLIDYFTAQKSMLSLKDFRCYITSGSNYNKSYCSAFNDLTQKTEFMTHANSRGVVMFMPLIFEEYFQAKNLVFPIIDREVVSPKQQSAGTNPKLKKQNQQQGVIEPVIIVEDPSDYEYIFAFSSISCEANEKDETAKCVIKTVTMKKLPSYFPDLEF